MPKQTTKKPSNVVSITTGKVKNVATDFAFSGDVMPVGGNPEKDRVSFNGVFDFAGVDMVDLYRMAAQTMVIKLAGNCRQKFEATRDKKTGKRAGNFNAIVKETIPARINVKEQIVPKLRSTSSANRVEKIASNIEKMSDEKKREMLERLTKMLKK